MGIWYATREQVKSSLEVAQTARADALVDAKIEAASRNLEGFLHRRFYPERKTVKFDFPGYLSAPVWTQLLDDNELISVETLTAGGTVIAGSDFFLRRFDDKDEPPYSTLDINLASSSSFRSGNTFQRAISILGLFSGDKDTSTATAGCVLGVALPDAVGTTVVLNPAAGAYTVGVGSLVLVGTERMVLRDRRMSATGQATTNVVDAQKNAQIVGVADGTLFAVGETILIDAERMRINDVAGNNLIVTRAWDGSALGSHLLGASVFALRTFLAERGVLGSVAAPHLIGVNVYTHQFPGPVNELCVAETVVLLEQNASGYARTTGSGLNERESAGKGLADVRESAWRTYGRKNRSGAV